MVQRTWNIGPYLLILLSKSELIGAVEKTRTSTGCPTATSTLRVYQFRHDRIVVVPNCSGGVHLAKAWGVHKSLPNDFSFYLELFQPMVKHRRS